MLMSKCLICGAEFPAAIVYCKGKNGDPIRERPYRKEICDECAGNVYMSHHEIHRYDTEIAPYAELAGRIERLVMEEYRTAYQKAMESAYAAEFDLFLTDDEVAFVALHRRILSKDERSYHNALTLGNLGDLLESMRRSVENECKAFRKMRKHGYDVFARYEKYKAWKKYHDQK